MLGARIDDDTIIVHPSERGRIKQMLLKIGWPAEDLAGYVNGEAHPIELAQDGWSCATTRRWRASRSGRAAPVWWFCHAAQVRRSWAPRRWPKPAPTTLILVTNTVAGRQWKRELIARTSLTEAEIGEYSGERKEIRPVTIATYQVITRRTKGDAATSGCSDGRPGPHHPRRIICCRPRSPDDLDLQSRRRLGLTAP